MKLEDVLYKTPEMTEERLIKLIEDNKFILYKEWARKKNYSAEDILKEWDLIQEKKSKLSKSQRDQICMLVSLCLIKMTKNEEENNNIIDNK